MHGKGTNNAIFKYQAMAMMLSKQPRPSPGIRHTQQYHRPLDNEPEMKMRLSLAEHTLVASRAEDCMSRCTALPTGSMKTYDGVGK